MAKDKTKDLLNKSILANIILVVVVAVLAFVILYQGVLHPTTQQSATTTVANQTQQSASTLAGIDQPLTQAQISVINNAPLSYFEFAGQKLLNGTLTNEVVVANSPQYNALILNGKPSVIYVGATSCIYCGENRWAMALALSRFGNFTTLYQGYSAIGDGDIPTLYWNDYNYTTSEGVGFGNAYHSNLINFISADYESPITGGFQVQPISYFIQESPNATYTTALSFMNSTNLFQGTPFTLWGTSLDTGADAVVFGNTTPTSAASLPLAQMTHSQVITQFQNFNDQFAWSEYAGADVYIAELCPAISNTAAVCALPAIKEIGARMGLSS